MADARNRPNLTDEERNNIAQWLLQHSSNGTLHYGAKKKATETFHVDLRTVWRVWKTTAGQQALGKPIHMVSFKKGSKHKDKKVLNVEKVKKLSVLERSSIRIMSNKLGVSKSLLHVWIKEKKIRPHTNAIKPFLTPENMIRRLTWSLSKLSCNVSDGKIQFKPMYDVIHVDEKWFNLTRVADMYYLLPDEIEPHRSCKSKRYIEKIMFLCAVGRPIIDKNGIIIFDGKIDIFPFIIQEPPIRNSKNRLRGTIQTKADQAITQDVIKTTFINELVPTIKAKWPAHASKNKIIQQDNAKPHMKHNDPDFLKVAQADGFNIQLANQPSNSPDTTNVNDLGFFRAIQTLKDQKMATTVDDLLKNMNEAFNEFPAWKLNNVFLTLQGCYHEIIKVRDNNNYRIPHMNKKRLLRLGLLPECLEVEEELVMDNLEYLRQQGVIQGPSYNVDKLVQGLAQVNLRD